MRFGYPLIISIAIILTILTVNIYVCFKQNKELVYPLDDAYIHMVISKNLAYHGVWGVTRFEFSSASSSPLYTLILAGLFLLFGVSIWVPLIFNTIAGIALLYLLNHIGKSYLKPMELLVFLISFILVIPLNSLILSGMEHTLQVFLCISFLWLTFKLFSQQSVNLLFYLVIASLSIAVRYEDAFLIGWVALAHVLFYKRVKLFILLMLAVALPVVAYGLFSLNHGSLFLPNSILVKVFSSSSTLLSVVSDMIKKIVDTSEFYTLILALLPPLLLFPIRKWSEIKNQPVLQIALVVIFTTVAHLLLAKFGWLLRYEAYLIGLVFCCIALYWNALFDKVKNLAFPTKALIVLLILVLLFPIITRSRMVFYTNVAMKNIHDQQLMMTGFIKEFYPGEPVAVNDIGAVSFYNDVPILDMFGIGSVEIIKNGKNSRRLLYDKLTRERKIKIAMIYEAWFPNDIPENWQKVGEWFLKDNYICGCPKVSIYAIDPSCKKKLIEDLSTYSFKLPGNVLQSGSYVEQLSIVPVGQPHLK